MTDRSAVIRDFLDAHGWGGAVRHPLPGDASFRRYVRLVDGDKRAMLMDAPPPDEDVRPFVTIARHLTSLDLSAPEILAEDIDAGLLLLEDLGDDTNTRVLANIGDEEGLYALAVDVLIDLHKRPAAEVIPAGTPIYDEALLLREAMLLPEWTVPAFSGAPMAADAVQAYADAWSSVFGVVHAQPQTLVLRDFHVDNLIWLRARDGVKSCGLLDFQDAVVGAPAYDLMSLLEDARRDVPPDLQNTLLEHYVEAFPDLDWLSFEDSFTILAAQRHAKVIGIFTRLCVRDGKPTYLVHIPRVWALLERALMNPVLAPVADWFDAHIPKDWRGAPPCP